MGSGFSRRYQPNPSREVLSFEGRSLDEIAHDELARFRLPCASQVAEQLLRSDQLTPQTREASILFADIEGFTRISETLTPAQVIELLNSFFGAATNIVYNCVLWGSRGIWRPAA